MIAISQQAGTCDPLVPAPASCLLPFPSDFYQKVDLSGVKSKSGYVMSTWKTLIVCTPWTACCNTLYLRSQAFPLLPCR